MPPGLIANDKSGRNSFKGLRVHEFRHFKDVPTRKRSFDLGECHGWLIKLKAEQDKVLVCLSITIVFMINTFGRKTVYQNARTRPIMGLSGSRLRFSGREARRCRILFVVFR